MKTIKEFHFPLLVLICSTIIVLFTSYGNKLVHPDLNAMMLGAFLKQNSNPNLADPVFKNYTFYFLQGGTYKGTAVIKDGLFKEGDLGAAAIDYGYADLNSGYSQEGVTEKAVKYISEKALDYVYSQEGPAEKTVKGWIVDGGYSADVPEVPASLRHFYDPTREVGDRYLTDIANAIIMGTLQEYVLTNPQIDGVQWALGKPGEFTTGIQDHKYTWESGKLWIQMALKETNNEKKNEYMANAWRSLGETLHMIADNGCPPHVRNDAHPSPLFNNNTWFGDPDPYEELIDILRVNKPDEFAELAGGSPDSKLKDKFKSMKTAAAIAHELAVYTNANFVTNETISGRDRNGTTRKQITHPGSPYIAPLLQNMNYNEEDYTYNTPYGVKQCSDRDYFADKVPQICEPRVTMPCVISQAKVLIPNIIEAGKNIIGLFIPKLKIEIKSVKGNLIKGEISHNVDPEYQKEIKYEGNITLQLKDKNYKILREIEVMARNGKFECKQMPLSTEEGILVAYLDFGGIRVKSDNYSTESRVKEPEPVKPVGGGPVVSKIIIYVEGTFDKTLTCSGYENEANVWLDIESSGIPISSGLGSFKGSSRRGEYFVEVSGVLAEDELVEMRFKGRGTMGCRVQEWDILVKNIPRINKETDPQGCATFQLRPYELGFKSNGVNMEAHIPLMTLKETSMDNNQDIRNLIETSWNRFVAGSTIDISPKNQQSAIEITVYR